MIHGKYVSGDDGDDDHRNVHHSYSHQQERARPPPASHYGNDGPWAQSIYHGDDFTIERSKPAHPASSGYVIRSLASPDIIQPSICMPLAFMRRRFMLPTAVLTSSSVSAPESSQVGISVLLPCPGSTSFRLTHLAIDLFPQPIIADLGINLRLHADFRIEPRGIIVFEDVESCSVGIRLLEYIFHRTAIEPLGLVGVPAAFDVFP